MYYVLSEGKNAAAAAACDDDDGGGGDGDGDEVDGDDGGGKESPQERLHLCSSVATETPTLGFWLLQRPLH